MLLRGASDREQRLLEEKKELEEQVEVLERFPKGAPSGATEVVRDLQLARLVLSTTLLCWRDSPRGPHLVLQKWSEIYNWQG